MLTNPDDLLDDEGIGRRLGVAPSTVAGWGRRGWIPRIRISRKVVRYVWSDVLRALRGRGACDGCGATLTTENVGGFDSRERAFCEPCAVRLDLRRGAGGAS